jgi:hypothetical protein
MPLVFSSQEDSEADRVRSPAVLIHPIPEVRMVGCDSDIDDNNIDDNVDVAPPSDPGNAGRFLSLFFANVTSFSIQAKSFLVLNCEKFDGFCLAETHVLNSTVETFSVIVNSIVLLTHLPISTVGSWSLFAVVLTVLLLTLTC